MAAPTLEEIKSRVPASVRATRNSQLVTDALNIGRTTVVEKRINTQDIFDTLGPEEGAAVIDAIDAFVQTQTSTAAKRKARPLVFALKFLDSARGLDVGNPKTWEQLDGLVLAGVMTQVQANKLKALSVVNDPAQENDVRLIVWSPDGQWLAD